MYFLCVSKRTNEADSLSKKHTQSFYFGKIYSKNLHLFVVVYLSLSISTHISYHQDYIKILGYAQLEKILRVLSMICEKCL